MRRRAAAVALAVCAAAGMALFAPAASALPRPAQPAADPAVQTYGGCVNGQRKGDLLLLIDESNSLTATDPNGDRVTAARYLLEQLATQTERAGIALDVQIAGFSREFDPKPTAWTALTKASVGGLDNVVDGFRTRTSGADTDYWTALNGAGRSLADHATAAGGGSGRCQAIAWFTDGKLNLEARPAGSALSYAPGIDLTTKPGADQAAAVAVTSLCRPQGLADGLRQKHVTMFAVGLSPPNTAVDEFDLMRSIATGTPYKGSPCGEITQPTPGTFQKAADVDALLRAFDDILGPTDVTTPPSAVCASGDTSCRGHEFVLDSSLDGVHILGQVVAITGVQAELIGPDGVRHPLSDKTSGRATPVDGLGGSVTATYAWETDRSVVVDLANPSQKSDGWKGLWALRFVDPSATTSSGTSTANIHIWGNVLPAWANRTGQAASGSTVKAQIDLAKAQGARVDPAGLNFRLSVDLLGPDGAPVLASRTLDSTTIRSPVPLDLSSVQPGQATLKLTLNLTTAPTTRPGSGEKVPGTTLSPQEVDIPLQIVSPAGFPTVSSLVDFGVLDGTAEKSADLTVAGPGCVWVPGTPPPAFATTPDGVAQVGIAADGVTSQQTCLKVAQGQQATIRLNLTADRPGNGTAAGTLPVVVTSADRPDQLTIQVGFTADFRKPVDALNFIIVLLAALLLGPGIPLGLLYFLKWLTARIPASGLYAALIPVTVDGTTVLREGQRFAFRDTDFNNLVPMKPGGSRRIDVGGIVLRTRIGLSPFGTGHVVVEPYGTLVGASAADPLPRGKAGTARLPLAVHNTWVVLHDPPGPPNQALLLVLVGADTTADRRREMADEIARDLPELFGRLRAAVGRPADGPPTAGYPAGGWPGAAGAPGGGSPPTYGSPPPTYGPVNTPPYGATGRPGGGAAPVYGPPGTAPLSQPGGPTAPLGPTQAGPPPVYGPPQENQAYDRFYGSSHPPGSDQPPHDQRH